ncbi:MAG: Formate dehydrogenase, nitrate-inducible, cytochrome b556(Fdn) subunit [Alphaproteobacteria bacterium MarineAlpha3_Bin5]|nr:formate dehydrogenase subunit gamma [Magnetovibrio sp.]PPR78081.1 MAG: Formate dehydrogenase, nitrate-inducible, cytochrome b556(Fdn) subunit [Alphaproteobacteria bacterium MarineAlpha3_Bin5]
MFWSLLPRFLSYPLVVVLASCSFAVVFIGPASLNNPAYAQTQGAVPGGSVGNLSDSEIWRAIRRGVEGNVSIPDKKAGVLVQSDGDSWRAFRNGPMQQYGLWLLLITVVVLFVYFAIRGRIKIDHGFDPQGRTIERFNGFERATHWLTASSFVVLGLTGLNLMYGRYFMPSIFGPEIFSAISYYGKVFHNYLAFAFMLGLVLMFFMWVRQNIPNMTDVRWLAVGGGLFSKGVHPLAGRFNAGQKIIFWLVILGGASLSFSGLALMFPFEITPWSGTFAILNSFGANLPTELSALQETQLSVLWHGIVGVVMIAVIIGHIYIGSIGMEGAIAAVGSGDVDLNWAKEHHALWVEEVESSNAPSSS